MYIVAGGSSSGWARLSSTETMVEGSSSWTAAGELPVAMNGAVGVSVNNRFLLTGIAVMQQLSVIIIILTSQEELVGPKMMCSSLEKKIKAGLRLASCPWEEIIMVSVL